MTAAIDFYFDFSSPYGYFAAMGIDALAAKYGRSVDWHPILLGVVFKTTGSMPLTMMPMKGAYALHDLVRTARFHGIPYRHPDPFPLSTHVAARAMLWLQTQERNEQAIAFAKAVYRAYFAEGMPIATASDLAPVLSGLQLDADMVLEGANSMPVKEQLRSAIEAAIARGVFGSPFILVDEEPFWGFDRFDQIEARLKTGIAS